MTLRATVVMIPAIVILIQRARYAVILLLTKHKHSSSPNVISRCVSDGDLLDLPGQLCNFDISGTKKEYSKLENKGTAASHP